MLSEQLGGACVRCEASARRTVEVASLTSKHAAVANGVAMLVKMATVDPMSEAEAPTTLDKIVDVSVGPLSPSCQR